MDRRSCLLRWSAMCTALTLAAVAALGCKSGLESFSLLYSGYDLPAEWDGLKGQKVAVVCKPVTTDEFTNSGAARALSEAICERLKARVSKITIIEPQKVADMIDKGLDSPVAIGKRLKADKVVAVDIESFGVLDGQTLYRGRAQVTLRVYDVATKEIEWHKQPPLIEFPSYGSTPASDVSEPEFRNKFIAILSDRIGRFFYPHDRYAQEDDIIR